MRHHAQKVVISCGRVCQLVRHFPYSSGVKRERILIHHWPLVVLSAASFGAALFLLDHKLAAGVVIGRSIEAVGDVLLDRGIGTEGV